MAKQKVQFKCSQCGAVSPKWQGQCAQCGEWNCLEEYTIPQTVQGRTATGKPALFKKLTQAGEPKRYVSGIDEFDRVVGGGLMEGSIVLVSGDPGIGKSTLALQLIHAYSQKGISSVYFSGEESIHQLASRAQRLGISGDGFKVSQDTSLSRMLAALREEKPKVAVIDSIQTCSSENLTSLPGSMGQIRECATELMTCGKQENIIIIFIGHITKSGVIAGPKLLEHMVDTVLYMEGDRQHYFRILRSVKNRFGSTHEVGIFEMKTQGMIPVSDPGNVFLSERKVNTPGSVVTCGLEGNRPIMIEVQALVAKAAYGTPQRHASGFDARRLQLLLAVMERRMYVPVGQYDVFINVVGGLVFKEPAMDLPVIAAIYSSFKDEAIPENMAIFGEVGLTGETRTISRIENRVSESLRMGFSQILIPKVSQKHLDKKTKIIPVSDILEMGKRL